MTKLPSTPAPALSGGPGYDRMRSRLGEAGYDALIQDTLRLQQEALAGVRSQLRSEAAAAPRRNDEYPAPKPRARRRAATPAPCPRCGLLNGHRYPCTENL